MVLHKATFILLFGHRFNKKYSRLRFTFIETSLNIIARAVKSHNAWINMKIVLFGDNLE